MKVNMLRRREGHVRHVIEPASDDEFERDLCVA